jgi:hypothetical protein
MFGARNIAVASLFFIGALQAQDSTPNGPEAIALLMQQVKALQQETNELREKVKRLEDDQQNGSSAFVQATSSVSSTSPTALEPAATAPSPSLVTEMHDLRGIQWRGFGELDYKVLNQRQPETGSYGFVPGSSGDFYTGDFDLLLTSRLTNRASVLSEMVFEEADAQKFRVNLHRVLLKYDYNDHIKMSFGRYQTNIGYYNWAFRSAAWLQTTADRPLIMEFASNGGLLPTQAVGVSITGTIPSGKLGLNYIAEYGSSDTIRPDINGSGLINDENNGNQVNIGFFLRPDAFRGLQIGGSYYHDKISNFIEGPSVRYGQTIINSYVVYVAHEVEFLNEGFLIRDSALHFSNAVFNTPAFYSQLSRKFGPIRPFVRYQYVNTRPDNIIYDDIGLRAGPSFGARYDLNDYIAFKAQLDHTQRRGEPDLNGLQLQLAFTF